MVTVEAPKAMVEVLVGTGLVLTWYCYGAGWCCTRARVTCFLCR